MPDTLRKSPLSMTVEEPEPDGMLRLESIGFACPLSDVYAQTHLGRANTT
jgi:hypothetical protein